jgi:hypothetical protein
MIRVELSKKRLAALRFAPQVLMPIGFALLFAFTASGESFIGWAVVFGFATLSLVALTAWVVLSWRVPKDQST